MPPPPSAIARFEIWYADLPPEAGHVQVGDRPCVVVADVPKNRFSVVLPTTTNLDRLRFTATHRIDPSAENGLAAPTVVMAFQIRYLDRQKLRRRVGQLSTQDQAIVDGLLADLLGFDGS
jgi:mRNA interferase MazF